MILSGKRVVIFIDYNANQTAVPYILDEYSHMWSTPFSPTDPNFPCTLQLPPNLNETLARDEYIYLANHNLNTEVSIAGFSLLIPNTANVSMTNGQENVTGQLEAMRINCTSKFPSPVPLCPCNHRSPSSPNLAWIQCMSAHLTLVFNSRLGPSAQLPRRRLLQLRLPGAGLGLRGRGASQQRHVEWQAGQFGEHERGVIYGEVGPAASLLAAVLVGFLWAL